MPDSQGTVKYRCKHCRHRLEGTEATCTHCGWSVDLKLAEEAAIEFRRKRDGYFNTLRRHKFFTLTTLALIAAATVVLILILINSFHWR